MTAKNVRIEAIVTEVHPPSTPLGTWLVFYFSGDYESGEIITTEEGDLIWLEKGSVRTQDLFPSIKEIVDYILDPGKGTVFAKFTYDERENIVQKELSICQI